MPTDKRLYPLATCSIGIWSTPDKTKTYLLLLPEKKLFVILLTRELDIQGEQDENALSVNGLVSCLRSQTSLWLRHKNPFVDHTQQPDKDRSVLTFEISWSSVVGMDFKWPLTQDARLVLEASVVVKRVFANVEAVCAHYQPQARSSRRQRPSTLKQLAEHHANPGLGLSTGSSAAAAAAAGASSGTAAAARQAAANGNGLTGGVVNKLHVAVAANDPAKQQGNHAGTMSRVSSWASWTSWASGRSSMEQTPTAQQAAATAPAAAAATDAAASASVPQQRQEQDCKQQQLQQQPVVECKEAAPTSEAAGNVVQSPLQQQQEGEAECSIGSQISPLGPALHSSPTLESGIAPGSLLAAALSGAAHSRTGSKSSDREATQGPFQELNFATPGESGSASIAWGLTPDTAASEASTAAAAAAAVSTQQQEPVLWPTDSQQTTQAVNFDQHNTADSNLAAAPDAALHVSAAVSNSSSLTAPAFSCKSSGGSLKGWTRPLRPIRLLQDNSPAGYATAPCSMPGSPKVGSEEQQGLLLQHTQQQLLQLYHEQHQQQQEDHGSSGSHRQLRQQKVTARDFSRGSSSSRSSRLRAAATTADRSCPLCNQPLLQPLHVLQQRFHDKQHDKQQQLKNRRALGAKQNSAGDKATSIAGKSRSACSLDQLLEQEMAANSSPSSRHQLQQPEQQQQQQQAGSTKSLAGRAAAAVGGLAARCVAAASASSSKDGTGRALGVLSPRVAAAEAGDAGAAAVGATAAEAPQVSTVPDKLAGCSIAFAAAAAAGGDDLAQVTAGSAGVETGKGSAGEDNIKPEQAGAAGEGCCAAPAAPAAATVAADAATTCAPADVDVTAAAGGTSTCADGSMDPAEGLCTYSCRTVVLTFKDPTLPHQLKKVVNSNVRMLKLYESGLPAWAVFMPSYGLWYRPWLRRVTWLLFVVLSVVSMAMGFYDLYKNVPYFKQAIIAMFSPAAAVFEWLEHHTQIRLSILLTYMLGKSQIFVQLIKLLTQTSLQPILAPIAAILQPLGAALSSAAEALAFLAQPFVALGRLALLLLQLLWQLVSLLLWSGPVQLLTAVAQGLLLLLQLLLFPLRAVLPGAASIRAGWTAAKATGQAAKAAIPVVKEAASTASSAARGTRAVWGWWWSPLEALELMRISTMRIVKSLQAVVRFFIAMLSTLNQHRLSLMLQLRQQLRGGLRAAAESPAGRVASAVAVKMGQEERVARLQERLRRTESTLVSVGSELLPADSVAVSTAFSLEGELSVGLMEVLGRAGNTPGNFCGSSQGGGESDDEVTSGVTAAPVSPAQVSPAQAYGSGIGLRYRGGGTAAGSSNRPGAYSRLGAGSSLHDTVQQLAVREDMRWQEQRVQAVGSGSCSKQVTFAAAVAEAQEQQLLQPVVQRSTVSVNSAALRRSLDAGIAAAEGQLNAHLQACTPEGEQELLLQTDKFNTLKSRLGSKSGSSVGVRGPVGQQVLAGSVAMNCNRPVWPSDEQLGVGGCNHSYNHDYGRVESGDMSRSCDVSSGFFTGVMDLRLQQPGVDGVAYAAASGAVSGASGAVRAGHRRNSW